MRGLIPAGVRHQLKHSSVGRKGRMAASVALVAVVTSLLAACTTGTATPSASGSAGITKLNVALVPATTWLPMIVAKEQGIFEKHGLDVNLTIVTLIPDAGLGKQFDIVHNVGPNIALAARGGIDEVAINNVAIEGDNTTAVMVGKDSGIKTVADLKGKRIGVSAPTSAMAQGLLVLLAEAGLSANDVTFQEMPFPTMSDQLASGQVDAITPVEPFASQAQAAGAVRIVNPIQKGGQVISGGKPVLVGFNTALRSWAEANPQVIAEWRASLAEAIEFIASNEAEARADLQTFSGLPAAITQSTPLYPYDAGPTQPAQVKVWIDMLVRNGTIPAENGLDPSKLVQP